MKRNINKIRDTNANLLKREHEMGYGKLLCVVKIYGHIKKLLELLIISCAHYKCRKMQQCRLYIATRLYNMLFSKTEAIAEQKKKRKEKKNNTFYLFNQLYRLRSISRTFYYMHWYCCCTVATAATYHTLFFYISTRIYIYLQYTHSTYSSNVSEKDRDREREKKGNANNHKLTIDNRMR